MLFHFKIVLYTLLITNLAENNVYHIMSNHTDDSKFHLNQW